MPFDDVSVGLNMVSAHACNCIRILEVARVVDCSMDKAQRRQLTIGGPLKRPDRCSTSDDTLDDRNQRCRIPQLNKLDVALLSAGIVKAKHPALFGTQLMATIILNLDHDAFVNLHSLPWITEYRW